MSADIIETAEQESTQETAEATSAPTSFADLNEIGFNFLCSFHIFVNSPYHTSSKPFCQQFSI